MSTITLSNTNIVIVNTSIDGRDVLVAYANTITANANSNSNVVTTNTISISSDYTDELSNITNYLLNISSAATILANNSNTTPTDYSSYFNNFGSWGSHFAYLSFLQYLLPISQSLEKISDDIRVLKERGDNENIGIVTRGVNWDSYGKSNKALVNMALDDTGKTEPVPVLRNNYNEALKKS